MCSLVHDLCYVYNLHHSYFQWLSHRYLRKDKYSGKKYYVEYEDEDELLHQDDDVEERHDEQDVPFRNNKHIILDNDLLTKKAIHRTCLSQAGPDAACLKGVASMKLTDLPDTSGDEEDDSKVKGKSGKLVDLTSGQEVGYSRCMVWFDVFATCDLNIFCHLFAAGIQDFHQVWGLFIGTLQQVAIHPGWDWGWMSW